ncbi:DNA mismatch repair protein MutS2 [Gracilibacillus orientalis]|uniref:Endonuclease MutS2 n=1 Tax=Gracilibacillus orientalis TaxID=334253 RepID=A0A1I4MWA7_9BACI|nr:endonuclease MutS2 [Gracilibacillus orientalis]SFM07270.1 DNA mismatch repair protein MutS2 [Gracilibacillus orientalis]
MNNRILNVLEYHKIIEQLVDKAASSLGIEKIRKLKPSTDLDQVMKWQNETDEAYHVIRLKGNVPLGGIFDIKPHVKRAVIGGILSTHECLDVASTIYGGKQLKLFIDKLEDIELPIIQELADEIVPLNELEREIKSCIDDHGHMMDGASDKLRGLRSRIRTNENKVRDRLDNLTKTKAKMLSDAIITIRNDRYVIPVKQEYRSAIGGIVHDQSASAQTLFMEPQSVVELNNQLQEARVEEKREIERILKDLSQRIAADEEFLLQNVEALEEIDFIFARAKLSHQMKASRPTMNDRGVIKMKQARHPLILSDEVVANDVELGEAFTAIVITGPNTGGKTVTLKMVGLCTLMAQSGLQVPALDGCELAVFSDVFADIGDEQSIEQSLSTFSSHMTNIVDILNNFNEKSLLLFDELGAGTDPQEGAALAMSILDRVLSKKARVIATTHYPELKAYGYNRDGVVNASVEFDIQTLKPTYRLLIGVPGRSNAFEISKRLGLHESIIEDAKSHIGTDSKSVENMIASLEDSRRKAETDYEDANDILEGAEQLKRDLEKQWQQFEKDRETLYKKAEEKAEKAVTKAREEAEIIVAELRNMQTEAELKEHEWIEAKKLLNDARPNLTKKQDKKQEPTIDDDKAKTLKPGDEVRLLTLDQKGTIIEQTGKNEFQVQIGIMKMKAKRKDILFIRREEPKMERPLATVRGSGYLVKPELDLRGERFEDAVQQLEKYIDDALLAGYNKVSIIHGKGTGALRKGVKDFARKHSKITSARDGNMGEGGLGVTMLELK